MDYKTVFEVTDKGFDMITLSPLLLVAVGIGISWFNIKSKSESPRRKFNIVFGFIFSGFALLVSIFMIPISIADRNKTQKIFKNKEYQVVEGIIEHFHPMPHEGHEVESFTVNDVYFEYSDYMLVYGFNNTASHGGPLKRNGQQVRLSYIKLHGENRILKIEIKE